MGVQESSPVRWMTDVRARYPAWDDLDDISWDTATLPRTRVYISGELRLSSLPLSYPEDLDMVTVRVVAIGYSSETQQYLYDEKVASIDV
jgi:hypothetical protein